MAPAHAPVEATDPAAAPALHADAAYRALRARDARFDGRVFVGVTSTGIYCRPVCRVKPPRRENCRFFANAALAEQAGFRPCLRCRPERAPGLSLTDSSAVLAAQAERLLAAAVHDGGDWSLPQVAARLGVTDRHLRRIFVAAHGVPPIEWLTTQRLLLAKHLLTDTALPVTQVALAAGFRSLRRFNAVFAERYRMNPGALRRGGDAPGQRSAAPTLRLAWRPPLDAAALLRFFERRAVAGLESVQDRTLRRTLALTHRCRRLAGWIEARLDTSSNDLVLTVAPTLAPALGALVPRARRAFDLDADPAAIEPVLADLADLAGGGGLGGLGATPGGVRLPGGFDGFETAVRVILGQQVSVAAACTLTRRLVQRFGDPVQTPFAGLDRLFPTAAQLAAADAEAIGTLGIVRQRVRAIQALAAEVAPGRLALDPAAALEPTLAALRALPGIGEWTVQLIAMRALAWPDAWPATDLGVLQALGTRDAAEVAARAEAWRPWRAYAVMRLWQSMENA